MQDISKICETGGRDYNQDYTGFLEKDGKFCLVVADGLGSYHGSDIASKTAVEYILKWFEENHNDKNILSKSMLNDVIFKAHNQIIKEKENDCSLSYCCTTIAVVISNNETSIMGHIGDTRIYEVKGGKIEFVTKDHSLAQIAVERGEITHDEIPTHKDQNKLLRVLGSEYYTGPDVKIDFFSLSEGDGFFVCTDGMWEYVTEDEIEAVFTSDASSEDKLTALKNLHDMRADEGCDNFSAVLAVKKGEINENQES